ncbi:MAG: flagellar filament capping protein FliD [Gammaproteobacteria bacterium]
MGTIISSGVGSGLDISGLVSQLVAAEGAAPAARLDREEASLQAELSSYGSLRSALAELNSALDGLTDIEGFRGRSVTLSKPDFLSASAGTNAVPGSYDIEVQQLAAAHRLASDPFTSADEEIGTGTLSIRVGAATFAVSIDDTNNTLAGIRDAINEASNNTGATATIVNTVDGSRLIITGTETGDTNTLTVTQSGGDGGLEPLVYDPDNLITNMTEVTAPQDAVALVNGFVVQSATNSLSDAIDGLDIELLSVNELGETSKLSVSFDQSTSGEAIESLINAYNTFIDSTRQLSSFDPETQERGPLFGDSTLRILTTRLRQELTETVTGLNGPFDNLFDLGITTQLDGKLSLDSAKLEAAFAENFEAVGTLFSDEDAGIASRLAALIDPQLETGGILDARTDGISASISDINDRREALNVRLVAVEERLSRQFNALDSLLAQLQSTSGFLTQQLDNLPGVALFGNNDN